jgi:hypothetical protein
VFHCSQGEHSEKLTGGQKRNQGQIVVEYVLLLVVTVSIAVLLTKGLIGRNPDDLESNGVMIQKWEQLRNAIAQDRIDTVEEAP